MKRLAINAILSVILVLPGISRGESSISALGFGLQNAVPGIRSAGMGMVSFANPDTSGLNLLAPALWDGSQTTRFCLYGNYTSTKAEDAAGSDASDESGISGLALAISFKEGWFAGLAISPVTRMGYEWNSTVSAGWTNPELVQRGQGGLSQGLVAVSMPLPSNMRLGLALRPIFGESERVWEQTYTVGTSSGIATNDRYTGVGWNLSWRYYNEMGLLAGFSVNGPTSIKVERQKLVYSKTSSYRTLQVDSTFYIDDGYDLPLELYLGGGMTLGRHTGGVELAWFNWGSIDNPASRADDFSNALRIGAGWEWSPEYMPMDPFLKSLTYRAGVFTQDHYYLSDGGHQARKTALTGGISIPYYNGNSRIDLALETGWLGDEEEDHVSERYWALRLGFNHKEKWFVERRARR